MCARRSAAMSARLRGRDGAPRRGDGARTRRELRARAEHHQSGARSCRRRLARAVDRQRRVGPHRAAHSLDGTRRRMRQREPAARPSPIRRRYVNLEPPARSADRAMRTRLRRQHARSADRDVPVSSVLLRRSLGVGRSDVDLGPQRAGFRLVPGDRARVLPGAAHAWRERRRRARVGADERALRAPARRELVDHRPASDTHRRLPQRRRVQPRARPDDLRRRQRRDTHGLSHGR